MKAKKPKNKKVVSKKPKQKATVKKIKKAKPAKKVLVKTKKHTPAKKENTEKFTQESLFKARIKVVGIGGGGGSIVSEIGKSLEKATFVVADTDIRSIKKKSGIKYFLFGQEYTHGLGTGVDVDLAKQTALSAREKIGAFFKDQDIIIFIASLGGGLGSGATQIFAEAAREFGGITLGIFTMPFKFEGKNKHRIAQNALKSLRQSLNVSLVIPNEKIFKVINANTAITDAFSMVNRSLIGSLESLIDLIYNPGIINIDFADLRSILRGIGNTAFLNTVEESGKDRAEKICSRVLVNPLLQSSSFEAQKILFNISGSDNLSMFEVEKISSHIASLNPKAKIIFGISKSPKLKNKIKTTILMTGGQLAEETPVLKTDAKLASVQGLGEPKEAEVKAKVLAKEKPKKKPKKAKPKLSKPKPKKTKKENNKKKPPKVKKENKKSKEDKSKQPSPLRVLEVPDYSLPTAEQQKVGITEAVSFEDKKTIRRSGIEIKKAEELEEKRRAAQEKEWEIPAFLRRVKFKS